MIWAATAVGARIDPFLRAVERHRESTLVACAGASVVVDFLNFAMMRLTGGTGVVIAAAKMAIFAALVTLVVRRASSWFLLLLFATMGTARMVSNLLHGDEVYGTDFVFLFRFLLTVAFVMAFRECGWTGMRRMYRLAFATFALQSATILAAFAFGIHFFDAYEYRDGYKGLFVHINDEAFLMAAGVLLSVQRFHELGDRRWAALGLFLLAGMAIMGLGSRTALLGALVVPILYAVAKTLRNPLRPSRSLMAISMGLVAGLLAAVAAFWETIQRSILTQLVALYAHSGSIVNALTTGRDVYIRRLFEGLDGAWRYALGSFIDIEVHSSQMMESDLFDLFFRFGLPVFPLLALIVLALYGPALRRGEAGLWSFLGLAFLIGGLTGHVLISSQNSMWIAFFLTCFGRNWTRDPGAAAKGSA